MGEQECGPENFSGAAVSVQHRVWLAWFWWTRICGFKYCQPCLPVLAPFPAVSHFPHTKGYQATAFSSLLFHSVRDLPTSTVGLHARFPCSPLIYPQNHHLPLGRFKRDRQAGFSHVLFSKYDDKLKHFYAFQSFSCSLSHLLSPEPLEAGFWAILALSHLSLLVFGF